MKREAIETEIGKINRYLESRGRLMDALQGVIDGPDVTKRGQARRAKDKLTRLLQTWETRKATLTKQLKTIESSQGRSLFDRTFRLFQQGFITDDEWLKFSREYRGVLPAEAPSQIPVEKPARTEVVAQPAAPKRKSPVKYPDEQYVLPNKKKTVGSRARILKMLDGSSHENAVSIDSLAESLYPGQAIGKVANNISALISKLNHEDLKGTGMQVMTVARPRKGERARYYLQRAAPQVPAEAPRPAFGPLFVRDVRIIAAVIERNQVFFNVLKQYGLQPIEADILRRLTNLEDGPRTQATQMAERAQAFKRLDDVVRRIRANHSEADRFANGNNDVCLLLTHLVEMDEIEVVAGGKTYKGYTFVKELALHPDAAKRYSVRSKKAPITDPAPVAKEPPAPARVTREPQVARAVSPTPKPMPHVEAPPAPVINKDLIPKKQKKDEFEVRGDPEFRGHIIAAYNEVMHHRDAQFVKNLQNGSVSPGELTRAFPRIKQKVIDDLYREGYLTRLNESGRQCFDVTEAMVAIYLVNYGSRLRSQDKRKLPRYVRAIVATIN